MGMEIYGAVSGTVNRPMTLNPATHALQTIDYSYDKLYQGNSFFYTEVTDVANGANRDILITTPNTTKWASMNIEVEFEGEALVTLYEGATVSAAGTALTELNANRNSSTTATTVLTHTPTVTDAGTAIMTQRKGSGKKVGGIDGCGIKLVLKQNEKYLLRCTNGTASNNLINIVLTWIEHTDLD